MHVVAAYERLGSPFDGYLCAPEAISDFYQKYSGPLAEAESALRGVLMKLLLDLLGKIWGIKAGHKVTKAEVETFGHPGWDAPDPVDYW